MFFIWQRAYFRNSSSIRLVISTYSEVFPSTSHLIWNTWKYVKSFLRFRWCITYPFCKTWKNSFCIDFRGRRNPKWCDDVYAIYWQQRQKKTWINNNGIPFLWIHSSGKCFRFYQPKKSFFSTDATNKEQQNIFDIHLCFDMFNKRRMNSARVIAKARWKERAHNNRDNLMEWHENIITNKLSSLYDHHNLYMENDNNINKHNLTQKIQNSHYMEQGVLLDVNWSNMNDKNMTRAGARVAYYTSNENMCLHIMDFEQKLSCRNDYGT